ncbi:MAG: acyltransferase [Acidobacteria bacterium]|nr:acyltransferase [Acidobacteriota bacterium]
MFVEIRFLIHHRERPTSFRRILWVWLKRLYFFVPVLRILKRNAFARKQGAYLGEFVHLGQSKIEGSWQNLRIQDGTSLGRCIVTLHNIVSIGRCVVINDGAQLLTGSHDLQDSGWSLKTGPISIMDHAWIATNAILLPGVTIGRGAVVGAGAVVSSDVPDFALVIGNPGHVIPNKRTEVLDYFPVFRTAPFEAWLGHSKNRINIEKEDPEQ